MLVPPTPPPPTPEYAALAPQADESPLDALARVGDGIVQEVGGSDSRDTRKNKKLPRQLAALVALRAQGFDNVEIAEKLGIDQRKLKALVAKARREYGWSDLAHKLADVAVPLAVDGMIKHIEHEGSAAGVALGRSTMIRAALSGVGVLKTHSAVKQESKSEQTNVLRVEIVLPQMPPGQDTGQIEGVLAAPRRALSPAAVPAALGASVVEGEVVRHG